MCTRISSNYYRFDLSLHLQYRCNDIHIFCIFIIFFIYINIMFLIPKSHKCHSCRCCKLSILPPITCQSVETFLLRSVNRYQGWTVTIMSRVPYTGQYTGLYTGSYTVHREIPGPTWLLSLLSPPLQHRCAPFTATSVRVSCKAIQIQVLLFQKPVTLSHTPKHSINFLTIPHTR